MPLLLLSRHAVDVTGEPVEWAQSWYRGDRYKFVTRLRRLPEWDRSLSAERERASARPSPRRPSRRSPVPGPNASPWSSRPRPASHRERRVIWPRSAACTGLTDLHELARYPDPLSPEAAARSAGCPAGPARGGELHRGAGRGPGSGHRGGRRGAAGAVRPGRVDRSRTWPPCWTRRCSSWPRPAWARSTTRPSPWRRWPRANSAARAWSSAAGPPGRAWLSGRI